MCKRERRFKITPEGRNRQNEYFTKHNAVNNKVNCRGIQNGPKAEIGKRTSSN